MADQVNVSWKADSNGKQIFQAAMEKWSADKPKSVGAGDFILDLIRRASSAEAAIETDARLEALGIKELVDMHRRRMEADSRMLEQIADLVADAQGKAESAVNAEITGLQKSKAFLEDSVQKLTADLEKAWQDLEQEKRASFALKESALAHQSEINSLQKKANDLEHELARLQTEREQAELAHKDEILKLKAEQTKAQLEADNTIERLQAQCNQLLEKLEQMKVEQERAQLQRKADQEQAQKERHESEKVVKELTEAMVKIASLEATVKGQQENITNMSQTLEVLRNFRAVIQKQPLTVSGTVVPSVKKTATHQDKEASQQGKAK